MHGEISRAYDVTVLRTKTFIYVYRRMVCFALCARAQSASGVIVRDRRPYKGARCRCFISAQRAIEKHLRLTRCLRNIASQVACGSRC